MRDRFGGAEIGGSKRKRLCGEPKRNGVFALAKRHLSFGRKALEGARGKAS